MMQFFLNDYSPNPNIAMMRKIIWINKQINAEQVEKIVKGVNMLVLDQMDKLEPIQVAPNVYGIIGTKVSELVLNRVTEKADLMRTLKEEKEEFVVLP
jgi:hypothetical protein